VLYSHIVIYLYFKILFTASVCDGFRTINIAQRFMTIRHTTERQFYEKRLEVIVLNKP